MPLIYDIALAIIYSMAGGWLVSTSKQYSTLTYWKMVGYIAVWPVILFYRILIEE